ncbi:hypothetical protein [Mycolicibacterium vinylchloridicum]|uniref:hypothetical protein n=1 Tax=Mycolicibacterium vinylchloridicum TaxID=2736928 RepID=UPI0015C8BDE3|nr:hypothetical protein [Mycolicibacterium vinylchloridicum]
MEHDSHYGPLTRIVAVVAAGAIVLATPSLAPPHPPAQLTSSRVSTQAVTLVAQPEVLAPVARVAAAASPDEIISTVFQATIGRVIAGAGSGFLVGFFGGGALALQVFGRIPVLGTPIVQAIAITAGIVGIPIGVVFGAISAISSWASGIRSQPAPAAGALNPQTSQRPAASSTQQDNIGDALKSIPETVGREVVGALGQVIAGAGGFAFAGFLGGGFVASGLMAIPVVGLALAPLVPVAAIAGAIVGAPVGAVVGALSVVKKWVSNAFPDVRPPIPVRPSAAERLAAAPRRSTQPDSRSNRNATKPTTTVRKAAAPQQRSEAAKAGSGRDRDAAAKRAGRH